MGEYSTDAILDGLIAAVKAAWGVPHGNIIEDTEVPSYDPTKALPYVVISPMPLSASLSDKGASVALQWEHNPFKITYRFKLPADPAMKATRLKTAAAQSFRDQFQTGPRFAGNGQFPLITRIHFARLGKPTEGAAEVVLDCECWTSSLHH